MLVRVIAHNQEEEFALQVPVDEDEHIYVPELVRSLREHTEMEDSALIFYLDSSKNLFSSLQEEENSLMPIASLLHEGIHLVK